MEEELTSISSTYIIQNPMPLTTILILLIAGIISGGLNAVAGGGSFVAFPVLIWLGLSSIEANATATLAVWPGTFATMFAYRKELASHTKKLPYFISLSILGGAIGALLLLHISSTHFARLVPYLLLAATLLFTFRTRLMVWIGQMGHSSSSLLYRILMVTLFVAICIYGGFFGAGMGILLLALLGLMGMHHMHEMNALRSCSGLCANSIAILLFAASGIILWPHALVMALGTIIGGYGGAYYARRLPQSWSRKAVIMIAWGMTGYFFLK